MLPNSPIVFCFLFKWIFGENFVQYLITYKHYTLSPPQPWCSLVAKPAPSRWETCIIRKYNWSTITHVYVCQGTWVFILQQNRKDCTRELGPYDRGPSFYTPTHCSLDQLKFNLYECWGSGDAEQFENRTARGLGTRPSENWTEKKQVAMFDQYRKKTAKG